jgi:hypothetical protein
VQPCRLVHGSGTPRGVLSRFEPIHDGPASGAKVGTHNRDLATGLANRVGGPVRRSCHSRSLRRTHMVGLLHQAIPDRLRFGRGAASLGSGPLRPRRSDRRQRRPTS